MSIGLGVDRLYHRATPQFSLSNISSSLTHQPAWAISPLTQKESEQLSAIFNQPFTLCGQGTQFYVFSSADGKTVLKFFKHHKLRPRSWFFTQEKREKQRELERTFASCKLAYETFREETGLLFIHLNKTHALGKEVLLIDKEGRRYRIDLDKYEFILQKRAMLLYPYITAQIEQGELARAKNGITQLLTFIDELQRRGIANNDPILRRNFGFVDNHPVQIDIGRFEIDLLHPSSLTVRQISSSFRRWVENHYPELALHFEAVLSELESSRKL